MLTSFLLGTNKQTQTDTLCNFSPSLSPSVLGFPAQWRIMGLTMCWPHHIAVGKHTLSTTAFWPRFYHSSKYLIFWLCCVSNPNLLQWKEEEYSQCRVTQTFLILPRRNREGNPLLVLCLVLTGLSLWSVTKSVAYGGRECVLGEIWQLFWECRGPPWVGNDVRSREQRDWKGRREQCTDADICCGIPEFWLRSVFGTQLYGIWFIPPLHFSLAISAYFAL